VLWREDCASENHRVEGGEGKGGLGVMIQDSLDGEICRSGSVHKELWIKGGIVESIRGSDRVLEIRISFGF
jgi:hypothetical protein